MERSIERPVLAVRRPGPPAFIELEQGDITQIQVDAVVNAANSALAGGGGVDGAIHRAAGPALMAELHARYTRCPPGSAVLTSSAGLSRNGVKYVVHAVGPIWRGGGHDEETLLRSTYRTALTLAYEAGAKSVAFPAISCGVYAYPLEIGSRVGLEAVRETLVDTPSVERCVFVLYGWDTYQAFARAMDGLRGL
jgi:O-acetyl-ADP-ribose deacetylase (regulator of RNase III)